MLNDLIATKGVVEDLRPGGPVGVMALHGGLEAGTAEVAEMVAEAVGATLYRLVQPSELRWHVPSVRFDPDHSLRLRQFLDMVELSVSFHGFGRRGLEGTVLLGGGNREMARDIRRELDEAGVVTAIDDLDGIPPRLRGLSSRNPVNRTRRAGVQVEMSPQVRHPEGLEAIATAVATVLAAEAASLEWVAEIDLPRRHGRRPASTVVDPRGL